MTAKACVNITKETQCLLARTLHNKVLNSSTMLFQELQPQKVFILYCESLGSDSRDGHWYPGCPVCVCIVCFRLRVHGTLQIGPTVSSYPPWAQTGRTRMKPGKVHLSYTINWENLLMLLLGDAHLMGRHPLSGGQSNLPVRPSEPRHVKNRERRSKNKPRAGRHMRTEGRGMQRRRAPGQAAVPQVGSSDTGSGAACWVRSGEAS